MEESQSLEKLPKVVTGILKNRALQCINCLSFGVDHRAG